MHIQIKNLGRFYINMPLCNNEAETLIKYRLFPATPVSPNVAFSFDLLDFYQYLLLEAHTPYLAFCRVLELVHGMGQLNQVGY